MRVALSLAILLFPALELAAQPLPIEVVRPGVALQEVRAGETITIPFRIANLTDGRIMVDERVRAPEGWQVLGPSEPILLEAGSTRLRLLGIAVPANAPAGDFTIHFEGAMSEPSMTWTGDSVAVRVLPHEAVELSILTAPALVRVGEPYEVTVLLHNAGNVPTALRLEGSRGAMGQVVITPDEVLLEPGDRIELHALVHTDEGLQTSVRDVLRIEAHRAGSGTSAPIATASVGLDLLPGPRASGTSTLHHLPLTARFATSRTAGAVVPLRVAGSGQLFNEGHHHVELLLQGPSVGSSPFGERDEYRLQYQGDRIRLRVGDHSWGLTPMSEPGYYGFGGGARLSAGPLTLEAHHARDRRFGLRAQSAARLGLAGDRAGVELGFLARSGVDAAKLWSARVRWNPHRDLTLIGEYGAALGGSGDAAGLWLEASGRHRRISYRFLHIDADADYPGRIRGVQQEIGHLNIRLTDRVRIQGDVNRSVWTPSTERGPSRRESLTGAATLGIGTAFALEARRSDRSSVLLPSGVGSEAAPSQTDERTESLRVRVQGSLGPFSVRPTLEAGRIQDRRTDAEYPFLRGGIHLGLSLAGGAALYGSVEREEGRGFAGGTERYRTHFTAGASADLTPSTRIRLALASSQTRGEVGSGYGFMDATLTQTLLGGHVVEARVRSVRYGAGWGETDPVIAVSYSIPLRVPVSRSRTEGRLVVRTVEAGTAEGVEGVRVLVGHDFGVTDRSGTARFGALDPGSHAVTIDPREMGDDWVPATSGPVRATVRAGHEALVEIPLTRTGRVTGSVRRFQPPADVRPDQATAADLVDAAAVGRLIVELTKGKKVHRRLTDGEGRFSFEGLLPGRWTVEARGDLPEWHELEDATFDIDVSPGSETTVAFRVLPVRRGVRPLLPGGSGPVTHSSGTTSP